ncbi:glycine cleavage system aminomethyltransferase GcvT [Dethiobacter alkaliphilus]|uniref:Aminomethyltransferase n=1 Tax=Dethiobacter alkaliphilus AHT 1 TaxID=555088 RepID=C0GKA7_DETAL|nr:glycine cleavage system aminomethyltransferase GcvT [Dethiobacter alkaliphilus]EEG76222.1 glycine cleavage system T protein [Dethiobacter alkaliphilus AHT 1]
MSEPKKTPLYDLHVELKAKVVDFNGWLLPVQYHGIIAEVHATREKAGLFDVSHMGEIMVEGKNAEEFLQRVLTNDVSKLKDNKIIYSPVCYPHGGTVDDILVYRYNKEKYLLVVNAGNTSKDFEWFQDNLTEGVSLKNISPEIAQLALQGPNSQKILQEITKTQLDNIMYYGFVSKSEVAGINCIISRTGYTGEDGFELYCPVEDATYLWRALFDASEKTQGDLVPVGLGARDVLRFEAALPLYGHELSKDITPLEAGLNRFVSFDKEVGFIGKEALLKQKEEGIKRKVMGLEMLERGIPREGYKIKKGEEEIGWVSSGSLSPTLDKYLGMAFLDVDKAKVGDEVLVAIRKREYRARVVKLPFYRRDK